MTDRKASSQELGKLLKGINDEDVVLDGPVPYSTFRTFFAHSKSVKVLKKEKDDV